MSRGKRARAALYLTLALMLAGAGAASAEVWRRPLWMENGGPVVEVWLSDRGPYRFLVDTGAEGTTVSREIAARLALPLLGAVEQHTVSGVAKLPLVRVDGLRLGPHAPVAGELSVAVSDLRALRDAIPGLDGVLGTDVLGAYDYLIDYTAGRLLLARDETLPVRGGVALPLQFDRRRPVVSWPRGNAAAAPLLLVVDSGADSLIVDAAAGDFTCRRRTEQTTTLETHTGRRDVRTCEADALRAGSLAVEGVRLVQVEWPTTIARVERGLLPASAFGRVYVSASQGTVTFWPR